MSGRRGTVPDMRRVSLTMAAVVTVTLLTVSGCAAVEGETDVEATPTPTPTVNIAEESCQDFAALSEQLSRLVVDLWTDKAAAGDEAKLQALPAEFDLLALRTEGVIGERIGAVASIILEKEPIVMSLRPDEYFAAQESVQRACDAAGVTIAIGTWS